MAQHLCTIFEVYLDATPQQFVTMCALAAASRQVCAAQRAGRRTFGVASRCAECRCPPDIRAAACPRNLDGVRAHLRTHAATRSLRELRRSTSVLQLASKLGTGVGPQDYEAAIAMCRSVGRRHANNGAALARVGTRGGSHGDAGGIAARLVASAARKGLRVGTTGHADAAHALTYADRGAEAVALLDAALVAGVRPCASMCSAAMSATASVGDCHATERWFDTKTRALGLDPSPADFRSLLAALSHRQAPRSAGAPDSSMGGLRMRSYADVRAAMDRHGVAPDAATLSLALDVCRVQGDQAGLRSVAGELASVPRPASDPAWSRAHVKALCRVGATHDALRLVLGLHEQWHGGGTDVASPRRGRVDRVLSDVVTMTLFACARDGMATEAMDMLAAVGLTQARHGTLLPSAHAGCPVRATSSTYEAVIRAVGATPHGRALARELCERVARDELSPKPRWVVVAALSEAGLVVEACKELVHGLLQHQQLQRVFSYALGAPHNTAWGVDVHAMTLPVAQCAVRLALVWAARTAAQGHAPRLPHSLADASACVRGVEQWVCTTPSGSPDTLVGEVGHVGGRGSAECTGDSACDSRHPHHSAASKVALRVVVGKGNHRNPDGRQAVLAQGLVQWLRGGMDCSQHQPGPGLDARIGRQAHNAGCVLVTHASLVAWWSGIQRGVGCSQ